MSALAFLILDLLIEHKAFSNHYVPNIFIRIHPIYVVCMRILKPKRLSMGKWENPYMGICMSEFPREIVKVDSKGRVTLPKKFRKALGLKDGEKSAVIIEAYPNLKNTKILIIKKIGGE